MRPTGWDTKASRGTLKDTVRLSGALAVATGPPTPQTLKPRCGPPSPAPISYKAHFLGDFRRCTSSQLTTLPGKKIRILNHIRPSDPRGPVEVVPDLKKAGRARAGGKREKSEFFSLHGLRSLGLTAMRQSHQRSTLSTKMGANLMETTCAMLRPSQKKGTQLGWCEAILGLQLQSNINPVSYEVKGQFKLFWGLLGRTCARSHLEQ